MNLYQLRDREDHNWGIIDTDAREETVTELWTWLIDNQLPEKEYVIWEKMLVDVNDYLEQLIALLRASQYNVERVWLTEINPE